VSWHADVASLSADGSQLKAKSGFTGYAQRTGEICPLRKSRPNRIFQHFLPRYLSNLRHVGHNPSRLILAE
jgi:hypothetical protein